MQNNGGQNDSANSLKRDLGVGGALLIGLGSILGTGVFVIVGVGVDLVGSAVLPAIFIGALLAYCNGLNSAQLAAAYPVSGGTYEYGYRLLNPTLGFTAGWMFMLAKSASASTAALGIAHYLNSSGIVQMSEKVIALIIVGAMTAIVLMGLKRTNVLNLIIVSLTIVVLIGFSVWGIFSGDQIRYFSVDFSAVSSSGFLEVCALVFVGYTGYGRIATMGEEIKNPSVNIPKAMWLTLGVSALIYGLLALAMILTMDLAGDTISLRLESAGYPALSFLVLGGASIAMLGVLLNLIAGLSRMLFAMARRNDMPSIFSNITANGQPSAAVVAVGVLMAMIILLGDIKAAWSFSAFTVLIYYAVCNLSAYKLSDEQRLYPKLLSIVGLCGCLFLAFWVDLYAWAGGAALIAVGLIVRRIFKTETAG